MSEYLAIENTGLRTFLAAVGSIHDVNDIETFWQCRPYFEGLLEGSFLSELASNGLEYALDEDVQFISTQNLDFARMQLVDGMALDIMLINNGFERTEVQCILEHTMFGFRSPCSDTVLDYDLYDLPDGYKNDVFDQTLSLQFIKQCSLHELEVGKIDAARSLYRLTRSSGRAILIFLRSGKTGNIAWNFDAGNLRQSDGISLDLAADRLCFAAQLLGEMGMRTSVEPLLELSTHRSHRVRWAAIQALISLDFTIGVSRLEAAMTDSHPTIRYSATQALKQISSLAPGRSVG